MISSSCYYKKVGLLGLGGGGSYQQQQTTVQEQGGGDVHHLYALFYTTAMLVLLGLWAWKKILKDSATLTLLDMKDGKEDEVRKGRERVCGRKWVIISCPTR